MSEVQLTLSEVDSILSPARIREQAQVVFERTKSGKGMFRYHEEKFAPLVRYVMEVIGKKYPDGKIPFHSRWGHFRAGGVDRVSQWRKEFTGIDALERARIEIDLVVTSVLLDAGAGAAWKYREDGTGVEIGRSEGLGVASFHMFKSGAMSGDRKSQRADLEGLSRVNVADLNRHFQVGPGNPLVGVEGRVGLLNGLSKALANSEFFPGGRPGSLIDYLIAQHGHKIPAPAILRAVLDGFGVIWPGRLTAVGPYGRVNLGDVWKHNGLAKETGGAYASLVPLHKLSQWLTYSLLEPIMDAGIEVKDISGLTGLAEYRNGGLLMDRDLISVRESAWLDQAWRPDSDLIIEWRALTVHFLDRIGEEVQKSLGKSPQDFPLAKVLEGGTWWAGRFAAKEKRPSADPPLRIESDGTVF